MIVLLIGPSNVGKSTLGRYAASKIPGSSFHDLDDLVANHAGKSACDVLPEVGADRFLELCIAEFDRLRCVCAGSIGLVAVGAGTLESSKSALWLSHHVTVAIMASAAEVCARDRMNRGIEEFNRIEFSDHRSFIYDTAKFKLDTNGLSQKQASESLVQLLSDALGL